jgi:hypothetical protein
MKKNILSMAALLMASATVFTACSSDDIISEQPANPTGKYTMTINASKGGDATTRALTLGRNDADTKNVLNATWATTENVYVKKGDTWAGGSLQPEADGATATLKGTLTGITPASSDVLTLQFPRCGERDYSGQLGTLEDIAANFDYATATVTVASVSASGNIVPEEATTTFDNQQAIVKFTLKDKGNGDAAISATKLVINDGTTDYTITPASATSEIYAAIPGFSGQTVTLTATAGGNTYSYEKTGVSFTNGQYYEITVKMAEVLKPDLLSGVFSVSSTKKVKFSKGNLRYASGTWSFFNNQYGYYTSYSADAWDKFGWSTAATNYGMNTSTSKSTYSGNFVDWGSNSDLQTALGTGWFTLSSAESTYLFNTRSASTVGGTSNGRFAMAKVNNVKGVILFPDTYTHPAGLDAPVGVNATDGTGWNSNNYTVADWTKMESAGCVFLPGAGYRDGESLVSTGIFGAYWSATSSGKASDYSAYDFVYFHPTWLSPAFTNTRNLGFSVRLVRQVTE